MIRRFVIAGFISAMALIGLAGIAAASPPGTGPRIRPEPCERCIPVTTCTTIPTTTLAVPTTATTVAPIPTITLAPVVVNVEQSQESSVERAPVVVEKVYVQPVAVPVAVRATPSYTG